MTMVGGGKEANRSKIRHTTSLCVLWNSLKILLIIVLRVMCNVLSIMWRTVISLRPSLGGFPLQARAEGRRCCYKYKILFIKMDNGIFEIMEDRRQCLTIRNKADTITKYVTKVRVTANLLNLRELWKLLIFGQVRLAALKDAQLIEVKAIKAKYNSSLSVFGLQFIFRPGTY